MTYQPDLFNPPPKKSGPRTREIRVFANDEIANSLQHLPMVGNSTTFASYKSYLESHLPYNSAETRQRRANYILERFYPDGDLNTQLTYFNKKSRAPEALKPVVFYHLAKAETILAKVAEELVYPALPVGKIERGQLSEFLQSCLPEVKPASIVKVIRAVINAYHLLNIGREENDSIKFQLHIGNPEAFMYILASEYPEPGIYSFESLFNGPAHRWLLWDREWIRKQLYSLRDLRIVSKVSEIDTVRQFSLELRQREIFEAYFNSSNDQDSREKRVGDKEP